MSLVCLVAAGCGGATGLGPAGAAGASGSAGAAGASACPSVIDFQDGSTHGLALGARNTVFAAPRLAPGGATNDQGAAVFARPVLALPATFPQVRTDTPSVGEVSILPAGCPTTGLAGRTVTVELYWKLDGAIGSVPTHGVSLGTSTSAGGRALDFSDASIVFEGADLCPSGDASCGLRTLGTASALKLIHVFSDGDAVSGLFLRAVMESFEAPIATTVYVGSIGWD